MTDKLFASLYLDEDVHVLLAKLMRARNFSVVTVVEARRRNLDDEEQLVYAAAEGRAIVTHNRDDYKHLAAEWSAAEKPHAGIIIAKRRNVHVLCDRLAGLLNKFTADEIANQLWFI